MAKLDDISNILYGISSRIFLDGSQGHTKLILGKMRKHVFVDGSRAILNRKLDLARFDPDLGR